MNVCSLRKLSGLSSLRRAVDPKYLKRQWCSWLNSFARKEFATVALTPQGKRNQGWLYRIARCLESEITDSKVETNYLDAPRFRITAPGIECFELELATLARPCVAKSRDFSIVARGKKDLSREFERVIEVMIVVLDELRPVFSEEEPDYAALLTTLVWWSVQCISRNKVEVRPTLACNHFCGFCNSPLTGQTANQVRVKDFENILHSLDALRLSTICISGGEPTLLRELPSLIEVCTSLGYKSEIQTNGMAFDDCDYAMNLRKSGLGKIFVSLHSAYPEVSDKRITFYEGGWERTVQGIDNAVRLGFSVQISHVIHTANQSETGKFLRFVNQRWGRRVSTAISFAAPTGLARDRAAEMIPDMADSARVVTDALAFAKGNGMNVSVTGHCGIPPCLLGEYSEYSVVDQRREVINNNPHHVKLEACYGCHNNDYCPGLWRDYVGLWGDPGLVTMIR